MSNIYFLICPPTKKPLTGLCLVGQVCTNLNIYSLSR